MLKIKPRGPNLVADKQAAKQAAKEAAKAAKAAAKAVQSKNIDPQPIPQPDSPPAKKPDKQSVKKARKAEAPAHSAAANSIRNWNPDDRPREKLLLRGAAALTDAELLAILLGSGTREKSAVELGQYLIDTYKGLPALARASMTDLQSHKGIGEAKALSIVAAFELAQRKSTLAAKEKLTFTSPASVAAYLQPRMEDLPHEVFLVLFIDNAGGLLAEHTFAIGGTAGTTVDFKLIFREAFFHRASAIVACHNHPSGNLQPSKDDHELTRNLKAAANTLDIQLLDHVIVGPSGYFSFSEKKLL